MVVCTKKKRFKARKSKTNVDVDCLYHLWRLVSANEGTRRQASLSTTYIYIQYIILHILHIHLYHIYMCIYIIRMLHSLKDINIIFLYPIPYINQPASENSSDLIFTRQFATVKTVVGDVLRRFNRPAVGWGGWRSFPNSVLIKMDSG